MRRSNDVTPGGIRPVSGTPRPPLAVTPWVTFSVATCFRTVATPPPGSESTVSVEPGLASRHLRTGQGAMKLWHVLGTLGIALLLGADPVPRAPGELPTLALPPRPDVIPGYAELDPTTGLHMTGTPQFIPVATWRLKVSGRVARPQSLGYDELRRMRRVSSKDPLVCRGYFEDYATWAGAPLLEVLERAAMDPRARAVELVSADGYRTEADLEEVRRSGAFLAYEWEGKALPELHGYPLRAVFPGSPGYRWVKWLVEIRVL